MLLKHKKCLARMEKRIVFVIVIQVPVCLKKVFINSSMQHLQNIIYFIFLYLQKLFAKSIDFKTHKQIK